MVPIGLGLVSRASYSVGRSKAAFVRVSAWIRKILGGRSGFREAIASSAFDEVRRSMTTGERPRSLLANCRRRWSSPPQDSLALQESRHGAARLLQGCPGSAGLCRGGMKIRSPSISTDEM